jgi:hypothetical protein
MRTLRASYPDVRDQRTDDRDQRTDDRDQRTEIRGQMSEIRGQMSEARFHQLDLIKNGAGFLSMLPSIAPTSLHLLLSLT